MGNAGASVSHTFDSWYYIYIILRSKQDEEGNIIECTRTVTVEDDEPPVIYCDQVFATNTYELDDLVTIKLLDTSTVVINVIPSMTISDFNILTWEDSIILREM
ncbi:MAG: hypothetical protein R2771_14155 [Saprospiraceae bacterium]